MLKPLVVALGLSVMLFGANGQSQPPQSAPMQQEQMPQVDMSDESIKIFVAALTEIDILRQQLSQQITDSQGNVDEEKLQQVNLQFQQEAAQIIEDEGLSIEEYSQYTKRLQVDPNFQQKVQELIGVNP